MISNSTHDSPGLEWFKSSHSSSGDGNDCIEVAMSPVAVHVRDSKNVDGARLAVSPEAFTAFVGYASRG
ncbi:DUF397 domain-containing protein [Streptomyces sp. TRM49041]|uniref:DUF397 domain-containing protein n=1 Tax=Streptomyces sp. TRM49041 TaxID=2603216 RepID=UPI0011EBE016|nr:DUF397 domain-containing protein [Streptomyces sp. TRM49041]